MWPLPSCSCATCSRVYTACAMLGVYLNVSKLIRLFGRTGCTAVNVHALDVPANAATCSGLWRWIFQVGVRLSKGAGQGFLLVCL